MAPKYNPQWFVPPKAVRNNAERGLEMRKKTGRGGLTPAQASNAGAGGKPIGSGVQRAVNLKNGSSLSPQTIKMMSAFFSRHEQNKDSKKPDGSPGAGKVAWELWGGDAGRRWADSVKKKMEAVDEAEKKKKRAAKTSSSK